MTRSVKYLLGLLFLVFLFSCEERVPEEPQVPDWLQPRIEELENSESCIGCTVSRITYNEEYFYHVYCGHWSCVYCEVYHHDGVVVDWQEIDFTDFLQNHQKQIILWECSVEE